MSRRKTRAQELARRWTKRKSQRQKRNARRNKAEKAERAILGMNEPKRSSLLTGFELDRLSSEYQLCRIPGESDARLRARIQEAMLGRPT